MRLNLIRVLLADDHSVLRKGLKILLDREEDIEVVGEASDGNEACRLAQLLQPDILVLDLSMPELNGLECATKLKRDLPDLRIIILTMFDDADYLKQALSLGIQGYVLKKALDTELLTAIRSVIEGRDYIYPPLAAKLLSKIHQGGEGSGGGELSEREKQVLKALALGYTNNEIAIELYISVKTVETHRRRISEKLGCNKRSELVRYAHKMGIVRLEEI
ncbi:MAG: two-component system response regulator [Desulfosporosinus sp. BRH_c37]|nr:MAG: two-component system response regulator [Desulfosporosinus sp. BRH_c37]